MRILPVLVVLAACACACGDQPFRSVGACHPLNFTVELQEERQCANVDDAFARAKQILVEEKRIIPVLEWDALPRETTIWVVATQNVDDDQWHDKTGSYDPRTQDIKLGRYLSGLVHELEHHYQMTRLGDSEAEALKHKRWDDGSDWKAADEEYFSELDAEREKF